MASKIDFHLHTHYSDGILSPSSLVQLAFDQGVRILSVSDHDCLDGLPEAEEKCKSLGMTLINGVELNTDSRGGEVHILGYDFDRNDTQFQERLAMQREYRQNRLNGMLERLIGLGLKLDEHRVREIAGKGAVGRPHLALALVEKNYVRSVDEAFQQYLAYGKPAWVPRVNITPQDAIRFVLDSGGIPVLAHPQRGGKSMIATLVSQGLQGLEVYYSSHTPTMIEEFTHMARDFRLITTIGSDYHGINPGEKSPGALDPPERVIQDLTRILIERGHKI